MENTEKRLDGPVLKKLGLTPESRARLARRMAEQELGDPDDDLFA